MTINEEVVKLLEEYKIDLNSYFILYCIKEGVDWHSRLKSTRIPVLRALVRRGLIDQTQEITEKGIAILSGEGYEKSESPSDEVMTKQQKLKKNFEAFWKAYPSSDKWGIFPRTRTLRADSVRAFDYFKKILVEGKYTFEDLMKAIKIDVEIKKKASVVENKMHYMNNICSWLNGRVYEGILEDEENNQTIQKNQRIYGGDVD